MIYNCVVHLSFHFKVTVLLFRLFGFVQISIVWFISSGKTLLGRSGPSDQLQEADAGHRHTLNN